MNALLVAVPAGDLRRYGELQAEEARRQAAGEDVRIVYVAATDELRIVARRETPGPR
ncbi:hypothetical protein ACFV3R_27045 [Streptomyces sp. NPDC059740]|uniref:hypothetical protein n=1 Tax=Streptomyces sp. NPDC059740 TaxID=3346926 RepID=UPI003667C537